MIQLGNIPVVSVDKKLNIYHVGNALDTLGWKSKVTPKYPTLHFTLHFNNIPNLDKLIGMLKQAVELVRKDPKKYAEGGNKMLEEINTLPYSVVDSQLRDAYHEIFNIENIGANK
jgi:hypothetical protein